MAKRRANQAALALTSNGLLLVNILSLLSEDQLEALRQTLPAGTTECFVGVPARGAPALAILARLDDAAAEAAAKWVGAGRTATRSRSTPKAGSKRSPKNAPRR
jgi:hypothetical protein